jgi:hypothetical protein
VEPETWLDWEDDPEDLVFDVACEAVSAVGVLSAVVA